MKLKLQTEAGIVYFIDRNDGHSFIATYVEQPNIDAESPLEAPFWTLWPKGQWKSKRYFKCFRELVKFLVHG